MTNPTITFVGFHKPVNLGPNALSEWTLARDLFHPSNGKITVEDKGNSLLFTYEAGQVHQRIKVPLANVTQVTEVPLESVPENLRKHLKQGEEKKK